MRNSPGLHVALYAWGRGAETPPSPTPGRSGVRLRPRRPGASSRTSVTSRTAWVLTSRGGRSPRTSRPKPRFGPRQAARPRPALAWGAKVRARRRIHRRGRSRPSRGRGWASIAGVGMAGGRVSPAPARSSVRRDAANWLPAAPVKSRRTTERCVRRRQPATFRTGCAIPRIRVIKFPTLPPKSSSLRGGTTRTHSPPAGLKGRAAGTSESSGRRRCREITSYSPGGGTRAESC